MEYTIDQLSHVTYLPGIGMKVYLKSETVSVDFLFSQMVKVEYEEDNNANANWKVVDNLWSDYPEAWRLEYPQVSYNTQHRFLRVIRNLFCISLGLHYL